MHIMITLRSFLGLSILFSTLIQATTITLPTVPTPPVPPKAIVIEGSSDNGREIKFSKRIPPNYIPHRFEQKEESLEGAKPGEISKGRISAYLRNEFIEVKEVEKRLKNAGFTVIKTVAVNKKKTLLSVVFTDESLLAMANKETRGFMATLRVLIDIKEQNINISNPLYMSKGFLQNDFDEKASKILLAKIVKAFPKAINSKDSLKFQILSNYQFMKAMPKYQDMIEIASGDDLLERIKKNKRVVFIQELDNGSVLIGAKLSKRTRGFTKKIGRGNAGMLPYPILIQNGKAKILNPKYYISFMYPLLTMSEFMTIATIPDAVIKDCKRIFRKKKKK